MPAESKDIGTGTKTPEEHVFKHISEQVASFIRNAKDLWHSRQDYMFSPSTTGEPLRKHIDNLIRALHDKARQHGVHVTLHGHSYITPEFRVPGIHSLGVVVYNPKDNSTRHYQLYKSKQLEPPQGSNLKPIVPLSEQAVHVSLAKMMEHLQSGGFGGVRVAGVTHHLHGHSEEGRVAAEPSQ